MNGRKLEQRLARSLMAALVLGALAACAHAPASREQMSILDVLETQPMQPSLGPSACAAVNATAVCEKSTRLDPGRNCRCLDPQALGGGSRPFRL